MPRTANRPIPRGDLSPVRGALIAVVLAVSGFLVLLLAHNLTSALLGPGLAWYNGFYTPLKRSAPSRCAGSLIGALPPAIGWTAAGEASGSFAARPSLRLLQSGRCPFLVAGGPARRGYEGLATPRGISLRAGPGCRGSPSPGPAHGCGLWPAAPLPGAGVWPAEIMLGLGAVWLIIGSLPF